MPRKTIHRKTWYFIINGKPVKTTVPSQRDAYRSIGTEINRKAYKAMRYGGGK